MIVVTIAAEIMVTMTSALLPCGFLKIMVGFCLGREVRQYGDDSIFEVC